MSQEENGIFPYLVSIELTDVDYEDKGCLVYADGERRAFRKYILSLSKSHPHRSRLCYIIGQLFFSELPEDEMFSYVNVQDGELTILAEKNKKRKTIKIDKLFEILDLCHDISITCQKLEYCC